MTDPHHPETPAPSYTPQDYIDALQGEGPLAYDWSDKPHRLVYDLVKRLREVEASPSALHALSAKWREEANRPGTDNPTASTFEFCADDLDAALPARPTGWPERLDEDSPNFVRSFIRGWNCAIDACEDAALPARGGEQDEPTLEQVINRLPLDGLARREYRAMLAALALSSMPDMPEYQPAAPLSQPATRDQDEPRQPVPEWFIERLKSWRDDERSTIKRGHLDYIIDSIICERLASPYGGAPATPEPVKESCERCQMRVPTYLGSWDIGVRGGIAFRCAACRPVGGTDAERELNRTTVVAMRKEKLKP